MTWPTCTRCGQIARPGNGCDRKDCPFSRVAVPGVGLMIALPGLAEDLDPKREEQ